MAVAELEAVTSQLRVEPRLAKSVLDGVSSAMTMCNANVRCVGISSMPIRDSGIVTGMIGVHGKVSGFVTVGMSEKFALRAVGGLLQDDFRELSSQVVDGVGEITNLIVGGIKNSLASSPWAFPSITVPSVIVGKGYQIAYAKGLEFVSCFFEHQDAETVVFEDRLMNISMSMLRL